MKQDGKKQDKTKHAALCCNLAATGETPLHVSSVLPRNVRAVDKWILFVLLPREFGKGIPNSLRETWRQVPCCCCCGCCFSPKTIEIGSQTIFVFSFLKLSLQSRDAIDPFYQFVVVFCALRNLLKLPVLSLSLVFLQVFIKPLPLSALAVKGWVSSFSSFFNQSNNNKK